MASVKLLKFLGEAPRITTELLPDGAAQIAYNAKLYSGDLIPYRNPVFDRNIGRTGTVKTIYPLNFLFFTYLKISIYFILFLIFF